MTADTGFNYNLSTLGTLPSHILPGIKAIVCFPALRRTDFLRAVIGSKFLLADDTSFDKVIHVRSITWNVRSCKGKK